MGYFLQITLCFYRNCPPKAISLPQQGGLANSTQNEFLKSVNASNIIKENNDSVINTEEDSLGALFCEFSGILDRLPKASSYISNISIPTIR